MTPEEREEWCCWTHADKAERALDAATKPLESRIIILNEGYEAIKDQLRCDPDESILDKIADLQRRADATKPLREEVARQRGAAEKYYAEVERLKAERDEAIAHDRQPYPTAEAYERVCTARTAWQERAEKSEARNRALVEALTAIRDDDGSPHLKEPFSQVILFKQVARTALANHGPSR